MFAIRVDEIAVRPGCGLDAGQALALLSVLELLSVRSVAEALHYEVEELSRTAVHQAAAWAADVTVDRTPDRVVTPRPIAELLHVARVERQDGLLGRGGQRRAWRLLTPTVARCVKKIGGYAEIFVGKKLIL